MSQAEQLLASRKEQLEADLQKTEKTVRITKCQLRVQILCIALINEELNYRTCVHLCRSISLKQNTFRLNTVNVAQS